MACAHSKWTGRIGCCLATSGPGGVHLLNGLYDAKFDKAAVIAITGMPYHDLIDTFTQQDVDLPKLFSDVAAYSTRIMSAGARRERDVAGLPHRLRAAHGDARGDSHRRAGGDARGGRAFDAQCRSITSRSRARKAERVPEEPELARAIEVLNRGKRVAILAGHGALDARDELLEVAELLGAPIVKALLGKGVVPDDHPLTTGGIGLLGTRPSQRSLRGMRHAAHRRLDVSVHRVLPEARARRAACRSIATPRASACDFPWKWAWWEMRARR